jgi:hypothetical protein
MWLDESVAFYKRDLFFTQPFVNTPGTLGFSPDQRSIPFLPHLGAFITNPISRRPRQPASSRACLPFHGGFLLHTGLSNPGISRVISRYKLAWAGSPVPVIIHLIAESPESVTEMVRKLEGLENIIAVELGLHPDCTPKSLEAILKAAFGELPLILCISPEQIPVLLEPIKALHPSAVHLMPPRGLLPNPEGVLIGGRLYGPATFPMMVSAAKTLVDAGVDTLAGGGVRSQSQVEAFLAVGVKAISLGSMLWQVDLPTLSFDSAS